MSSKYKDLTDFLLHHRVTDKTKITHTRIGSKSDNIYGGAYEIKDDEKKIFLELYYDSVFNKKKKEYLTEKQKKDGVLAIDLDFRYDDSIDERQHDEDDIINIIDLYIKKLNDLIELPLNFNIFVF